MHTIIFSDTHLSNWFDKRKNDFLISIIEPADQVIINGDFWDRYLCTFNQFTNSKYKHHLFPLLKEKKAIYIYGNHDKPTWMDEKMDLFSNQQLEFYQIKVSETLLHIEHCDRMAPAIDHFHPGIPKIPLIGWTSQLRHLTGFKIGGKDYYKIYQEGNNKMKDWIKSLSNESKILKGSIILAAGHSHLAEDDLENKFINSGSIAFGYGTYIEIKDENIKLISCDY